MNKKKLAALALSGTLLMGGAGFGAYSWFTSQAPVDANLNVTTGTLKITAKDSQGWKAMDPKTECTIEGDKVTNARPGDTFYKLISVKNEGTLKEVINASSNTELNEQYKGAIDVTVGEDTTGTAVDKLQNIELKPGEHMSLRVVVRLNGEKMGNEYNGKVDVNLNKALKGTLVTIDGTQVNDPSVPEPHTSVPTTPVHPAH